MPSAPRALTEALADRYRLERELGSGGMATVYLAEDLKHKRMGAVEVVRPELAATLGPERFAREIEVAARLQHPHILPLHDSGEARGFLYYVMPYVEGVSLRQRLTEQGELPIPDAVRILTEIVEALAYAPGQGVGAGDRIRRGDDRRRGARYAGVHGARTGGRRPAPRSSRGHLRGGRDGLRVAHGATSVHGDVGAADPGRPHESGPRAHHDAAGEQ